MNSGILNKKETSLDKVFNTLYEIAIEEDRKEYLRKKKEANLKMNIFFDN